MDAPSSCCFLGVAGPYTGTTKSINTPLCCAKQPSEPKITRRTVLKRLLTNSTATLLAFGVLQEEKDRDKSALAEDDRGCKNCQGGGKVSCELCLGTGFWRAFAGNDDALRYRGVTCPECEGSGNKICPVCLGTGEGNVRGLLRRRTVEPGKGRILQSG